MISEAIEAMAAPENLLAAWRAVRGNVPRYRRAVSAGPDAVTLADFERDLPAQLNTLGDMLLHGRYEPAPPKPVHLPKPAGGERVIGVLNVADRVAQRAAVQVLAPLWEVDFLECNFGFRPGRGTPTAVAYIRQLQAQGNAWVVESDIADCFGSLNHDVLLKRVQVRVGDPRVVKLVERWLACGALSAGAPDDAPNAAESDRWRGTKQRVQQGAGLVMEGLLPGVMGPHDKAFGGRGSHPDALDGDDPRLWNYDAMLQADLMGRWAGTAVAAGLGWLRPNIGRALYQSGQFLNTPAGASCAPAVGRWPVWPARPPSARSRPGPCAAMPVRRRPALSRAARSRRCWPTSICIRLTAGCRSAATIWCATPTISSCWPRMNPRPRPATTTRCSACTSCSWPSIGRRCASCAPASPGSSWASSSRPSFPPSPSPDPSHYLGGHHVHTLRHRERRTGPQGE